jgi:chemotaxis protein methyltransferase CheR
MEELLRELQQAMAAHRRALDEKPDPAAGLRRPRFVTPAGDARLQLMQRLTADVERLSGIEITATVLTKLSRALSSVDLAELELWVGRLHLLPADDPEWLSLIECVTVHETFFHRDRYQLELLARRLLPEIIAEAARSGRRSLRFWSAGCATGEEAYTLAILGLLALRDAGFAEEAPDRGIRCRPPWRLDVLGTDISRLVLAQAQAAVYPTHALGAFRDLPRQLERFFPIQPQPAEAELRSVHAAVKQHVRFGQFNLLNRAPAETGFDIVLCRNVLIYLTVAARGEAQGNLKQALRPGGYLLLGPTDTPADPAAYEVCWGEGAVAYRRKSGDA